MASYKISGIKERIDYSFALKSVHEEVDDGVNSKNGEKRKKALKHPQYDIKRGILTFSTESEINPFVLNMRLAERGLELKILK